LKVYLDDERVAPDGWVQVRWPEEAIKLMKECEVTHMSLDHDLGDDQRGTGYDVLLWIEREAALHSFCRPRLRFIQPILRQDSVCWRQWIQYKKCCGVSQRNRPEKGYLRRTELCYRSKISYGNIDGHVILNSNCLL